jgi:hypothetical protein
MSDEFTPDEVDAVELLRLWIERCYPNSGAEQRHGAGMVSIIWFIAGGWRHQSGAVSLGHVRRPAPTRQVPAGHAR